MFIHPQHTELVEASNATAVPPTTRWDVSRIRIRIPSVCNMFDGWLAAQRATQVRAAAATNVRCGQKVCSVKYRQLWSSYVFWKRTGWRRTRKFEYGRLWLSLHTTFHAQIKKFCIFLLLYLYFGFFLFLACLLLDCLSVGFCEILTTRGDREQEERAPHQKRRNKLIKVLSVQFGSTSGYVGSFALSFSPRHRKK